MSQTPTKGPWAVQSQGHICSESTGDIIAITTSDFENKTEEEAEVERLLNAEILAEAGTVYHETNQTPRQILESREALRGIVEEFIRRWFEDGGFHEMSHEDLAIETSKALTLAKEGGQA